MDSPRRADGAAERSIHADEIAPLAGHARAHTLYRSTRTGASSQGTTHCILQESKDLR